jgi:hypothetical protein
MHLIYFDENKYSVECPFFYLGGIILQSDKIDSFEKTLSQIQYNYFGSNVLIKENEMHGNDMFHGKSAHRKRKLSERVGLFENVTKFIITNKIPIRLVCIDVIAHRKKYSYPEPEYQLGLMLLLERFCDYLDKNDSFGIVFGDHEKDEVARSIKDFSQFKISGKTKMYFGRPLGRLIDTIYYTESHHSRFLQLADMVLFMAQRYEKRTIVPGKWHEEQLANYWNEIKSKADIFIQNWP